MAAHFCHKLHLPPFLLSLHHLTFFTQTFVYQPGGFTLNIDLLGVGFTGKINLLSCLGRLFDDGRSCSPIPSFFLYAFSPPCIFFSLISAAVNYSVSRTELWYSVALLVSSIPAALSGLSQQHALRGRVRHLPPTRAYAVCLNLAAGPPLPRLSRGLQRPGRCDVRSAHSLLLDSNVCSHS